MKKNFFSVLILILTLLNINCKEEKLNEKELTESKTINEEYYDEILRYRAEKDSFFRYSDDSPFKRDTTVQYLGIKWFEINSKFKFQSKLYKYNVIDTVIILGTKGEGRHHLKYGWFEINFEGKTYKLNCYKYRSIDITPKNEFLKRYLGLWFRDKTSGEETYYVGRYLETEPESDDENYIYTLDFNKAYNPYCAYTPLYTCPIPRKEDYLDFKILAGEKKYHQ